MVENKTNAGQKRALEKDLGIQASKQPEHASKHETNAAKRQKLDSDSEKSNDDPSDTESSISSSEESSSEGESSGGSEDPSDESTGLDEEARGQSQFRPATRLPGSDLRARLQSFLPQIAAANRELVDRQGDDEPGSGFEITNVDDDDDDAEGRLELPGDGESEEGDGGQGPYIEMNLQLGVLEEKRAGARDGRETDETVRWRAPSESQSCSDAGGDGKNASSCKDGVEGENILHSLTTINKESGSSQASKKRKGPVKITELS